MTPERMDKEFSKQALLLDAQYQQGITKLAMPRIKEMFNRAMASNKKVKRLGAPEALKLKQGKVQGQILFNGGRNILLRVLTPVRSFDMDEIRCCPRRFSWLLDDLMQEYLNSLRSHNSRMPGVRLTHASCPVLHVDRAAYMMQVFLWGYAGTNRPVRNKLACLSGSDKGRKAA